MKIPVILFTCFATVHLAMAGPTHAADTNSDRIAATREYLKVAPVENMTKDLTTEMLKTIPPEQQGMARDVLKKALDPEFMESLILKAMTKNFTTDEIKALTRFYASPEGASIMKKFGAYMADIMPAVQSRIMTILTPALDQKTD